MRSWIVYLVSFAILGALALFGVLVDYRGFAASLFAAAVSIFVVIFIEMELKGKIRIVKEPKAFVLPNGRTFLRVMVENPVLRSPFRFIMDRRPIYQARASIKFLTEKNDPLFNGREMIGRWSNTPEPLRPISIAPGAYGTAGITFLRDLSVTRDSIDIACGASELLDIVMRDPKEDKCRGWHNRIIENSDPAPEDSFDLAKGCYHALVRVDASGRRFTAIFRIVFDLDNNDFRLEPLGPGPRDL